MLNSFLQLFIVSRFRSETDLLVVSSDVRFFSLPVLRNFNRPDA